ncbi:MAG: class I SAM-dependent methyltransferase [Chloroflexi bacterium]|nr:class I SAM-dependent methyltransferase [Chloroflexota bacterium]
MTTNDEMLMRPDEYRVMFEIENAYWWYRGLRTLLKSLLKHHVRLDSRHALILDAGCGTGANLKMLQDYGRAIGIDLSPDALRFCHRRGIAPDHAFAASVTDLPFVQKTFDLAVSFDVICNIPDDVNAFAQVARVLKPGGYFIVQLPAYQWLWSMHDVAVGHQRRYSARDTRAKLVQAGFQVERVLHTNALLLPFAIVGRMHRRRILEHGSAIESDLQVELPRLLNAILSVIYGIEIKLEAHIDSPFGLSVIAIAKKK